MYDIAIIGGMGPEATAALFSRLIARTQAASDQEHMSICVFNDPKIPDRTEHLLYNGPNPLPRILKNIELARDAGCKRFVIPCNTAHYFAKQYQQAPGIAFINMIEETRAHLQRSYPGQPACVLATHGTVRTKVYGGGEIAKGPDIRYPSPQTQDQVMEMIRQIKSGNYQPQALASRLLALLEAEQQQYPVYVLACTELSLLYPALSALRPGLFVDALEVLVQSAILACGYQVKKEA